MKVTPKHHTKEESALLRRLLGGLKEYPMPEPSICAVYLLIHRGTVIYVGATTDMNQRIRSHWKQKAFDEVRYIETDDMDAALDLEAKLIDELRPPLNKAYHLRDGKGACTPIPKHDQEEGIASGVSERIP